MPPIQTSHSQGRRTYVVYEIQTGRIAHTVHVEILKGAQAPSDAGIEEQVLISAAHVTGIHKEKLRFLAVDPNGLKPGMAYNVDLKTGGLNETKACSSRTRPSHTP
jgi:hypothetical protein